MNTRIRTWASVAPGNGESAPLWATGSLGQLAGEHSVGASHEKARLESYMEYPVKHRLVLVLIIDDQYRALL